jgi:hypothetical protein
MADNQVELATTDTMPEYNDYEAWKRMWWGFGMVVRLVKLELRVDKTVAVFDTNYKHARAFFEFVGNALGREKGEPSVTETQAIAVCEEGKPSVMETQAIAVCEPVLCAVLREVRMPDDFSQEQWHALQLSQFVNVLAENYIMRSNEEIETLNQLGKAAELLEAYYIYLLDLRVRELWEGEVLGLQGTD